MQFILNNTVDIEESLTCEFKEVKAKATQVIGKCADEYIVAFLNSVGGSIFWGIRDDRVVSGVATSPRMQDELRQVVGQKIASIAPHVEPTLVSVPFHAVYDAHGGKVADVCIVEIKVNKPVGADLFLTGSGEAYRKTIGGTKKLTGAEVFLAISEPLKKKQASLGHHPQLERLPSVLRRSLLVEPMLRNRRVLWVDDKPENTFYERVALAEMGLQVDVALSTNEALELIRSLPPDVIVSDMERRGHNTAGLELLSATRSSACDTPVIFYVGMVDEDRGIPQGAFDITDRPDEVLHSILDALERIPD